jgi:DNA-binding transcriptional LysR family regulator
MNLRQLEYFVAVAEEQSFTRAAERLYVAQPSISQQLRALEAELGGPLLERLPRTVRLTPAGRELLPEARAAILAAERAGKAARTALGLEAGELEVATLPSLSMAGLPRYLQQFRQRHPEVGLRLREYTHPRLLETAVREGVGDLAVGTLPHEWDGVVVPLGWQEFVVVLPAEEAGDDTSPLSLSSLADRRWVLFEPGHGLAEVLTAAAAAAGFVPEPAARTSQIDAAARMAAAGLGPALVPATCIPDDELGISRRLRRPVVRRLAAYARGELSGLAQAFLDVIGTEPSGSPPPRALVVG